MLHAFIVFSCIGFAFAVSLLPAFLQWNRGNLILWGALVVLIFVGYRWELSRSVAPMKHAEEGVGKGLEWLTATLLIAIFLTLSLIRLLQITLAKRRSRRA